MEDRDFLLWLHERLHHIHGENKNIDFMGKLYSIALATPPGKITPNLGGQKLEARVERETKPQHKTFLLNDVEWTPGMVRILRESMIQLRDEALKQAEWDWTIQLSLCVGVLHFMAQWMEEESK